MRCLPPQVISNCPLSRAITILGNSAVPPCKSDYPSWVCCPCTPSQRCWEVTGPSPGHRLAPYHKLYAILPQQHMAAGRG